MSPESSSGSSTAARSRPPMRPPEPEADHGVRPGAGADLGQVADGGELAVTQDGHPVGEVLGLVHVVGGQEDRLAELLQPRDHVPGAAARRGVEAGGRLVEEDELRVADDPDRNVNRRRWPPESVPTRASRFVGQPDELDRLVHRAGRGVEAGEQRDQLAHRESWIELALLQNQADPRPPLARRPPGSVPSTETSPRCACDSPPGSRSWSSCRRRSAPGNRTPLRPRPRS